MNVDNKLIAEFLGYETYEMNGVLNVEYSENNIRTIQDTHYHIDWNWLMQVVEKIESLPNELCNKYFWNKEDKQQNDFRIFRVQKIDDLYNQCVEFIKWYNEQNK
jgi:hypothetical protein